MTPSSIVPAGWAVPEVFRLRMGETVGRQRLMAADGHLLLVLHAPPDPDDDLQRRARLFWRHPDGSWKSIDQGSGISALRVHLAEFFAAQEQLDALLQQATTAEEYFEILQYVAPLQRTMRNTHRVLQEAREQAPTDRGLITVRDSAGDLERALELLHADAKNGLDFTIARQAEQQARSSYAMGVSAHRLNIMAALFLPLATVSSVLGMNLPHGLETSATTEEFYTIITLAIIAGLVLCVLVSRRAQPPEPVSPARRRVKMKRMKRTVSQARGKTSG